MLNNPIVVLDSNELILGLKGSNTYSKSLIDNLSTLNEIYDFRINDGIFQEVIGNIPHYTKEKFGKLLNIGAIKKQDFSIDKNLISKYKNLGLKKGDIVIAAYAELCKANFIISENRHFLQELKTKKFKIVNAEQFLKGLIR